MSVKVFIKIEDLETMENLLEEGAKRGLFKNLNVDAIRDLVKERKFPIQIPVELNDILDLAGNPIIKKIFGSKIESAVSECLLKILEAG